MGDSKIEWTEKTWNPVTGCSKVSQGCKNCYAERLWPKVYGRRKASSAAGAVAGALGAGRKFTDVACHEDRLKQPLGWRKPQRVFVNSMSDLFHEDVPESFIDKVFAVMALCPQHQFQILTKRPKRMLEHFQAGLGIKAQIQLNSQFGRENGCVQPRHIPWPLPNVWLGVSVEDQATADARIPDLLATPAAVRFVSAEPLLGAVDFRKIKIKTLGSGGDVYLNALTGEACSVGGQWNQGWKLDLVIVGGESGTGPDIRPMHPDWPRRARDQCKAAGVAFFFKQWGAWEPLVSAEDMADHLIHDGDTDDFGDAAARCRIVDTDGTMAYGPALGRSGYWQCRDFEETEMVMRRVGKKAAGRVLDGRTWNEMPGVGA